MDNYGRIENGEKRLLYWILGVIGSLLVVGVVGIWRMDGNMGSLQQAQADTSRDVGRLQDEFDRYVLPNYQRQQ